MSPRVSIVVPTKNSELTLESCLKSIKTQNLGCRLIVVDNHSTDRTPAIARELADVFVEAGPERSAQRNIGAKYANTEIVGFVDSDMVLSSSVVFEVVTEVDNGANVIFVPEETIGEGYWANVRKFERDMYIRGTGVEAARFFSLRLFDNIGGFDEDLTGAEDWDLSIRASASGTSAWIESAIYHHEGNVKLMEVWRKKLYYAPGVSKFIRKHGGLKAFPMSNRPWIKHPTVLLSKYGAGLILLKAGELMFSIYGLRRNHRSNNSV